MSTLTNYEGLLALSTSPHLSQVMREYLVGVLAEHRELVAVARAAVEYDAAIRECANDPDKMASHCTAEGETLDDLYCKWITAAHTALAKVEA